MANLSIQDFCAAVYCAIARCDAIPQSPVDHLVVEATVAAMDVSQRLRMEFEGVHGFSRRSERQQPEPPCGPEDVFEFTAVELERTGSDWRVWINAWDLEEIEFRCAVVRLNGLEVEGEGRWLQDWLPEQPAQSLPAI